MYDFLEKELLFLTVFSEANHKAETNLTDKGDQPKTCNSTSLPNEATRPTDNECPFFPTKA
ncbi:hypothetical protein VIA_002754 [Vibrio orientalis CIP 102891 = ATCC 33934]|uniref:Uncharacterized protein n=1 Tax=Vibrio orientalis CIP 102891 = ATCC 33934 TaxID=675816 RepID=A0ABM9YXG1_VIBOR|nr:hypothetical protein VIA_002754 [Vibrio orientalis CIP 102891 = ATCC 33934]